MIIPFEDCYPRTLSLLQHLIATVTVAGYGGTLVDGCVLTVAARANNGEQLAVADGFGRVRLLRYPAVNDDQVSKRGVTFLFGMSSVHFVHQRCTVSSS